MDNDSSNGRQLSWLGGFRRFLGGKRRVLSEQELQEIIEESEEEGIINEDEGEMFHSIFEFGETIVREVMVPRTDMVCVSLTASLAELLKAIIASGHSRIPVFEGTADSIVGIIYAKDLLKLWGCSPDQFEVKRIMRTPYFVPETKQIEALLQEFRTQRVHMAIAIDEYGGTSGLITIENLIEEIIGDIQDEYDIEEDELVEESPGVVLVDGRLSIEELEDYFETTIPREKFDTVSGYLFNLFGYVPHIDEEIRDGTLVMTVVECDDRTIRKVRVRLAQPGDPSEDGYP